MEGAGFPSLSWPDGIQVVELTTYGKPIRDCIRNDLLGPVSVLYFIILDITCTQPLVVVWF